MAEDTSIGTDPTRVERIPLWSAKWSREELLKHWQTLTDRAVAHGYGQFPASDEDLLFDSKAVDECKDESFVLPEALDPKSPFMKMQRVAGLDIASGKTTRSAWWVLMTLAIDVKTDHRWVIGLERRKGLTLGEQFDIAKSERDRLQFQILGVESNNVQNAIGEHMKEAHLLPAVPVHTGSTEKTSETVGIPAMASEFERKLWHIPWGDARSQRIMTPFVQELKAYPTAVFFDTVMSAYFAREMWAQRRAGRPRVAVITY